MAITAAVVNELRQATGCGLMDCKKALIECEGDMEKAVMYLREKGLAISPDVYTVDELSKELVALKRGGGKKC